MAVQLLPTPRPQTNGGGAAAEDPPNRQGGPNLMTAVSLLPTPRAWDEGGTEAVWEERQQAVMANGHCRSGLPLSMAVQLLPTPQEFDSHFDSLNISDEAAERQLHRTDGIRRRTTGSLTKDLLLLKTPTAQLASNGGSQHPDKRRSGGHTPTLADEVEFLLPTPMTINRTSQRAQTGRPTSGPQRGGPSYGLEDVVEHLLPTPNATDSQGGPRALPERRTSKGKDHGPRLRDVAPALLPTPAARDWKSGQSHVMDRNARPLNEVVEMLLPTPTAGDSKASGSRNLPGSKAHPGVSLTDAIQMGGSTTPRQSHGATTSQPSAAGKPSSDGQHPGQLSLDGLENA
jgi:hypothetical protein